MLTKQELQPIIDLINTYKGETHIEDVYFEHIITVDAPLLKALQPLIATNSAYNDLHVGAHLDTIELFDDVLPTQGINVQDRESYLVIFDDTIHQFVLLTHDNAVPINHKPLCIYLYRQPKTGTWMRYTNHTLDEYMYSVKPLDNANIQSLHTFVKTH